MVCNRCVMVVANELEKLGLNPFSISMGEVVFLEELDSAEKLKLLKALHKVGFDILEDKDGKTIEKIKALIINLVQNESNELDVKLSVYLSEQLNQDYNSLSNLFSATEGKTIEKYFIHQKIEKVKELLVYDELSLSEIAFQLNYSSVAYLSNQFKKVTGFTPTYFKNLKEKNRRALDTI